MALGVLADTFEEAVAEAETYIRMGALDEQVLKGIAFDYEVRYEDLIKAVGWSEDHYE